MDLAAKAPYNSALASAEFMIDYNMLEPQRKTPMKTITILLTFFLTSHAWADAPTQAEKKVAAPKKQELFALIKFDLGDIKIKLFSEKAPNTVANFVTLARNKYYDKKFVYEAVEGLAVQLGAKNKKGQDGVGYTIDDEFHKDLVHNLKGKVSMSSPGPDMNGGNFLITLVPTPHFDQRYSMFGEVVSGMEVVDKILEEHKKKKTLQITSISIEGDWYETPDVQKRTPFSTDDIKKLTIAKAREILESIGKIEGLGDLKEIDLKYKSIRGRKAQVAYEAKFSSKSTSKVILLGKITDKGIDVSQFQYQQLKALKK